MWRRPRLATICCRSRVLLKDVRSSRCGVIPIPGFQIPVRGMDPPNSVVRRQHPAHEGHKKAAGLAPRQCSADFHGGSWSCVCGLSSVDHGPWSVVCEFRVLHSSFHVQITRRALVSSTSLSRRRSSGACPGRSQCRSVRPWAGTRPSHCHPARPALSRSAAGDDRRG